MKIVVSEMPKNCSECLFKRTDTEYNMCFLADFILDWDLFSYRDKDCPLLDIKDIK